MSLQKPSFTSNLPEYLLKNVSEKDKYILENLSIMGQVNNWLIDETTKQNDKLESVEKIVNEVDEKLRFTNGKIGNAMIQIKALESKNEANIVTDGEVKQLVSMKLFVQKYLFNRVTAGLFFIFVIGVMRVISDEKLMSLVFTILGLE